MIWRLFFKASIWADRLEFWWCEAMQAYERYACAPIEYINGWALQHSHADGTQMGTRHEWPGFNPPPSGNEVIELIYSLV